MTVKTFYQRLSGELFPKSWKKLAGFDVAKDTPFIIDVVPIDNLLHVYVSGRVLIGNFHERLIFKEDGTVLAVETYRAVPRGLAIVLNRENANTVENITVELEGKSINLDVQPSLIHFFEGLNTVFLCEINPDPDAFKDWLSYHCGTHELEAVVLLRRGSKKWSGQSSINRFMKIVEKICGLKTFALLDSNLPLGDPGQPSIYDRHTTPDGPGKAMLDPPVNDPYESALYELAAMDIVRRKAFDHARAVAYIGQCDLLKRNAVGQTVFDAADVSESYLKFMGTLTYPWSYRKAKKPHFADHTCISFDGRGSGNVWVIGRKFMEKDPVLRPFRASQVEPDPISPEFGYWRCMGMRYPKLKIGQLVPKASLVVSEPLCALMEQNYNHATKRPPEVVKDLNKGVKNDKIVVVTTMKNEGPFMLEWLAYHMSIGVTNFIVYTNDCTDGTDTMFDILDSKGIVEHRENPYRETGQKPQHAAYLAAQSTPTAKAADWVICMDVDEYINVHVGDGTLHDLFKAVPDANVISMTWRLFGNAEVDLFEDKFITEQFFRCAPKICRKPHQAWGFKTMFRNNGIYKKYGVHRPVGLQPELMDQIHWVNGSGVKMPDNILRTGWRSSVSTYGYDLVTLNHYALRSCESFLVKRDRGRVNHVARDQGMAYWFRMNNNAEHDESILKRIPRAKEKFDELMADSEIAEQHLKCVAAHKKRIGELKLRPDYMEMYETLKSERMVKLSRLHAHFGSAIFLGGPETVPEDFPHLDDVEL